MVDIINADSTAIIVNAIVAFVETLVEKQGLGETPSKGAIDVVKQTSWYWNETNPIIGEKYRCQWSGIIRQLSVYTPISLEGKALPKQAVVEAVGALVKKGMEERWKLDAHWHFSGLIFLLREIKGVKVSEKAMNQMKNYRECGEGHWQNALYGPPISTRGLLSLIINTLEVTPA